MSKKSKHDAYISDLPSKSAIKFDFNEGTIEIEEDGTIIQTLHIHDKPDIGNAMLNAIYGVLQTIKRVDKYQYTELFIKDRLFQDRVNRLVPEEYW